MSRQLCCRNLIDNTDFPFQLNLVDIRKSVKIHPISVISGQNCHRLRYFIAHPKLSALSRRNEVCDHSSASVKHGWKTLRSLRPLRENINHPAIVTFPQKSTNLGRKVNPFSMEKSCKRVHLLWCTYHPDALCCLLSTTLLYIGTYSVYSLQSTVHC
jgi:hypothetical protein